MADIPAQPNDEEIKQSEIAFDDPFYSSENLRKLRESFQQLEKGKVVERSIEELEKLTDA